MGLETQFLVFLRVAVLHRFYCKLENLDVASIPFLVKNNGTCQRLAYSFALHILQNCGFLVVFVAKNISP